MEGRITIELRTEHTPGTGSGLPDLGYDAYWLMKRIPELPFKDANGKERTIGEKYEVVRVSTRIG